MIYHISERDTAEIDSYNIYHISERTPQRGFLHISYYVHPGRKARLLRSSQRFYISLQKPYTAQNVKQITAPYIPCSRIFGQISMMYMTKWSGTLPSPTLYLCKNPAQRQTSNKLQLPIFPFQFTYLHKCLWRMTKWSGTLPSPTSWRRTSASQRASISRFFHQISLGNFFYVLSALVLLAPTWAFKTDIDNKHIYDAK